METGFLLDQAYVKLEDIKWSPGNPHRRTVFPGILVDSKSLLSVHAFRCPKCAVLQLVAK